MRFAYVIAFIAFVFAACYHNNILSEYLTPGNLPEQIFIINTQHDTTVVTAQGIKIQIPAAAIEASGDKVTLVIKEALTLEDMLRAGLTTTTNGELLASDGMFYINTKEKSNLIKPLHIFLPTAVADNKMQLYNGAEENGKIDWQNPQNIDKPVTNTTDSGEILFKQNCASCHAADHQATGPLLAWEDKRKPQQWLRNFTRNSAKVLGSGDKYACCIYNMYKSAMTSFDSLSDYQIDAIYRYIDKMSRELGVPQPAGNEFTACDSCNYYHEYYYRLSQARDSLVIDNGPMVNIDITPPKNVVMINDYGEDDHVVPPSIDAEYYQFNVTTFGWLNVDELVSGFPNLAPSNLKVALNNAPTDRIEVFMIVPAYKIFQRGGLLNDGKSIGFYKKDGTVNLMQGQTTVVFGVGEEGGKMYFGETAFAAALSQNIAVNIQESTKKEIERFFRNVHAEKIKMEVAKTKNYKSIKAIDDELGRAAGLLKKCSCVAESDSLHFK